MVGAMRALVIATFSLFALGSACKKADKPADTQGKQAGPKAAPATAGTVAPDGTRHIDVEANKDGYTPAKIEGKPGEKLVLVFKRTFDAGCIAQVKVAEGKLIDLPLNQPVEVAVTVPQTGEVGFACGMDMFHGVVVAKPAS